MEGDQHKQEQKSYLIRSQTLENKEEKKYMLSYSIL